MHIVCVQFDIAWQDKKANFAAAKRLLGDAEIPRGSLIVLPEMFATGFSMDTSVTAEERAGATETFLAELADKHRAAVLGGLAVREADGKVYNEAVAVEPGGQVFARYAKMHLFGMAGETQHHAPGRDIATFEWEGFRVFPAVCYDLRFPELFRAGVRAGANVFCVLANWPAQRMEAWMSLLRVRAIENQAYVVGVNRVGRDPNESYAGASVIFNFAGEAMAGSAAGERVIVAEVDLPSLENYRREFPVLGDVRGDLLGPGR